MPVMPEDMYRHPKTRRNLQHNHAGVEREVRDSQEGILFATNLSLHTGTAAGPLIPL